MSYCPNEGAIGFHFCLASKPRVSSFASWCHRRGLMLGSAPPSFLWQGDCFSFNFPIHILPGKPGRLPSCFMKSSVGSQGRTL